MKRRWSSRRGFTLADVAVSTAILGMFAAFGMPRVTPAPRRPGRTEALVYLSAVREAQERQIAADGSYTTEIDALQLARAVPEGFAAEPIRVTNLGPRPTWRTTLVASPDSGQSVTCNQDGFDDPPARSRSEL